MVGSDQGSAYVSDTLQNRAKFGMVRNEAMQNRVQELNETAGIRECVSSGDCSAFDYDTPGDALDALSRIESTADELESSTVAGKGWPAKWRTRSSASSTNLRKGHRRPPRSSRKRLPTAAAARSDRAMDGERPERPVQHGIDGRGCWPWRARSTRRKACREPRGSLVPNGTRPEQGNEGSG